MNELLGNVDPEKLYELGIKLIVNYGTKLLGAIAVLVAGLYLIKILVKAASALMDKREFDASLKSFLKSALSIALKALLAVTVLSMIGIEMTSFVAILGAAGLAVGMALSGTLQNFAGGVIILILKPFKVGDVIDAKGFVGTVDAIQIFNTHIRKFDNQIVIVPNGELANASMTNITREATRRNEWMIGIAYGDDYDLAKKLLLQWIAEDTRILKDPEPFIALHSLGDSSVNIVLRAWSTKEELWNVYFALNERVYKEFPQHGLNIPFPQMDVHVHQEKTNL